MTLISLHTMNVPLYKTSCFILFLSFVVMYISSACNRNPYEAGSDEGVTIRQNPLSNGSVYYPWNDGVGECSLRQ